MHKYFHELEKRIKIMFDEESSGHDFYHLKRVYNLAMHITKGEGGDKLILGASAILHDVHRLIQNKTGKHCDPKDSLPKVKKILSDISFPKKKIVQVLHCIEHHEEYSFSKEGKTVFDKETLILQDADNLDAMGAIGIGRTFAYMAVHNLPMWIPDLKYSRKYFDEATNDPSTIHHIETKMMRLHETMNTKTGQRLAKERTKYMKKFVDLFKNEWSGTE